MKRLVLTFFIVLSLAITCEEVPPLDGPAFVDVANGQWELIDVKRVEEGSVDGIPYYQDYETDSIYFGTMEINDSIWYTDISFSYIATEIIGGGQYSSGVVNQSGNLDIYEYDFVVYDSGDTLTFVANSFKRNIMELELNVEVIDTLTGQTGNIMERFTWSRVR